MFNTSVIAGCGIQTRGSIENPNTPLSAIDEDWDDAFGIVRSESGVRVSRRTALAIAAWFRGVNVISRYVAKTPLYVQKSLDPNGKERDYDHFAHRLVRRKANPQMTAFTVKQVVTAHAVSEGNGYVYIRRKGNGEAFELWPLLPDRTYPVRINGTLWYVTEIGEKPDNEGAAGDPQADADFIKRRRKLRAEDVIHIKGLGYDGLVGYNVIRYAAQTLGLAIAGRDYGSKYFKNNASGRVVLEAPHVVEESAAKRMLGGWRKMTEGLNNAHKTAILEQGVKANILSANAKDAQLIELMQWGDKQVANWLNLPEHMIGGEGRTSYASLEQENQRFLDDSLDPWFCVWEEELWDKLLTEEQKNAESHDFEFLRQALVRTNLMQRTTAFNVMHQNGAVNVDEWRGKEGMNPLPNGLGKTYFVPMNMQPRQGLGAGDQGSGEDDDLPDNPPTEPPDNPPPDDDNEDRSRLLAATRATLRDAMERMAKRLMNAFRQKARPGDARRVWLETFARQHHAVMRLALRPAVEAAMVARHADGDVDEATRGLASDIAGHFRAAADRAIDECPDDPLPAIEASVELMPDHICDAFLS